MRVPRRRTDRHAHRRLPADTELARTIKVAARQHQEAIWARQQAMGRLRSLLQEFYPQALATFPNLTHRAAAVILRAAPTPQAAQRLTPRRVAALLQQAGRRNDPGLAERISTTLQAPALRQPTPVEHALGVAATGLIEIITAMSSAIHALERELAQQFDQHTQAEIITSMPGLGPVLGARVLGELGDDPDRFADARGIRSFAGTAPDHPGLRPQPRGQLATGLQPPPRRRLPLVGLRRADQITRRARPLRPPPCPRRHPQRGAAPPGQQTDRQALALPPTRPGLRRNHRLDRPTRGSSPLDIRPA